MNGKKSVKERKEVRKFREMATWRKKTVKVCGVSREEKKTEESVCGECVRNTKTMKTNTTQHQLMKEQKVLKQHNEKEKEQNIHCNEFEGELQYNRNNQHIPCLSEANKHSKRLM